MIYHLTSAVLRTRGWLRSYRMAVDLVVGVLSSLVEGASYREEGACLGDSQGDQEEEACSGDLPWVAVLLK